MLLPTDDPIVRELYGLAWTQAQLRVSSPPRAPVGPFTKEEHLALLATLTEFTSAIETGLIVAASQAHTVFKISQADIGRACGVSRQAIRLRLAKSVQLIEEPL